jgi:hypothetical protein
MALLLMEGFESFGPVGANPPQPAGIMGRKYNMVGGESDLTITAGRNGLAMQMASGADSVGNIGCTTNPTLILGVAVYFNALPGANYYFLGFSDGYTLATNLCIQSDGHLQVNFWENAGPVTSFVFTPQTWYYLELKVYCHPTAGTIDVHVNGNSVYSATGQDTKVDIHNYNDTFRLRGVQGNGVTWVGPVYDDFYLCDGSGTTNNDFLGDCTVLCIRPASDGTTNVWTPSSGSDHHAMVDEATSDDDATYLEASATGQLQLFNYNGLTGSPTIYGVQINTEARTDSTSQAVSPVMRASDGTVSTGGAVTLGSSYATAMQIEPLDAKGNPWTAANLNTTQFGFTT